MVHIFSNSFKIALFTVNWVFRYFLFKSNVVNMLTHTFVNFSYLFGSIPVSGVAGSQVANIGIMIPMARWPSEKLTKLYSCKKSMPCVDPRQMERESI